MGEKKARLALESACTGVVAKACGISHYHLYRTSKQDEKDKQLRDEIEKTWEVHPSYGQVRLSLHLGVDKKRIKRVCKKFGIRPPRRKVSYCTKKSKRHHSYTNLIKDLIPTRANQAWISDVSFFRFMGRWWYLATIEDLFTREIVAAQISRQHDRWLVLSTCKQAILKAGAKPDIFHSDQGSKFIARACTLFWEEQEVAISVSDTGSPWQNGYQESFFGHFKQELGRTDRFSSPGEFIVAVYQQIHYYNQERIHTSIKMPPARYAKKVSENPRHVLGT